MPLKTIQQFMSNQLRVRKAGLPLLTCVKDDSEYRTLLPVLILCRKEITKSASLFLLYTQSPGDKGTRNKECANRVTG